MYGLLWYDNICPIYNLIIWNMRVQKKKKYWENCQVVQIKFLAMHITNQNLSFDIFTIGKLQNIFMEQFLT